MKKPGNRPPSELEREGINVDDLLGMGDEVSSELEEATPRRPQRSKVVSRPRVEEPAVQLMPVGESSGESEFVRIPITRDWKVRIPTQTDDIREAINESLGIDLDNLDLELSTSAQRIGSWSGPSAAIKGMLSSYEDEMDRVEAELFTKFRTHTDPKTAKPLPERAVRMAVRCDPEYVSARKRFRDLERQQDMVDKAMWAFKSRHEAIIALVHHRSREMREATLKDSTAVSNREEDEDEDGSEQET